MGTRFVHLFKESNEPLGVTLAEAAWPMSKGKVIVHAVRSNSPAAGLLHPGDVIIRVNELEANSAASVARVLTSACEARILVRPSRCATACCGAEASALTTVVCCLVGALAWTLMTIPVAKPEVPTRQRQKVNITSLLTSLNRTNVPARLALMARMRMQQQSKRDRKAMRRHTNRQHVVQERTRPRKPLPMHPRSPPQQPFAQPCTTRPAGAAVTMGNPAALDWLRRWQKAHRGMPQFRPAVANASDCESRIPRRILMTARNPSEALTNFGKYISTFWEKSPEYEYNLLSDEDCQAYVQVVGSSDERRAYGLLKVGAARSDLFRAIFLRDLGGVYVDTDTSLLKPLRSAIPPWASIVTEIGGKNSERASRARDPNAAWNFNFLAFEPGSSIWHEQVQRAVDGIFREARFACTLNASGCKGHYVCVQNTTGAQSYRLSVADVARRSRCSHAASCANATDEHLRRLLVLTKSQVPIAHHPCHVKLGGASTRRHTCRRPKNETEPHYVGIPEAAWAWHKSNNGRRSQCGSSAPAYFEPLCDKGQLRPKRRCIEDQDPNLRGIKVLRCDCVMGS